MPTRGRQPPVKAPDALPAVAFVSVVVAFLMTNHVRPSSIGGLGLFAAMPLAVWLAIAAVVISFAFELSRDDYRSWLLALHVIALATLLDGLPVILEELPRFPTAWLHVGFVQAFITHHHPYTAVDARFSWPGFFTAFAAFVGMAGWQSALPALQWFPVGAELAYAVAVFGLARLVVPGERRAWLIVWAFLLLNWVGQDYFSPQAVAYFLFLTVIMALFSQFQGGPEWAQGTAVWRVVRRRLRARHAFGPAFLRAPVRDVSRGEVVGLTIAILAVLVAVVMSHQLTPVVLLVDIVALVSVGRCRLRYLPVILTLMVGAWLSYAAVGFWSGHLSQIFGSGGSSAVAGNLTGRLNGSSTHLIVVYIRAAIAAALWLAVGCTVLYGLRRGSSRDLALSVCAAAPFPVIGAQAYGGEAQLRVYLFTLPFMLCMLLALPKPPIRRRMMAFGVILGSALLIPCFLIARFGNEIFEQVRPDEKTAIEALYRIAPPGSTLLSITPNVAWRYKEAGTYRYKPDTLGEFAYGQPKSIKRLSGNARRAYLIVTTSQIQYAITSYGFPRTWGSQVLGRLSHARGFTLVYHNPDARIYRLAS